MSVFDIIALILMIIFAISGIFTGFIKLLTKKLGFLAGLVVAFFIAAPINNLIAESGAYNGMVGSLSFETISFIMLIVIFILLSIIIALIIRLLGSLLKNIIEKVKLFDILDKILGFFFGAASGLFIVCLMLVITNLLGSVSSDINTWFINDLSNSFGLASGLNDFANYVLGVIQ